MGTKKLEYAQPIYSCELKVEIDSGFTTTECPMSPRPDCRKCPERDGLESQTTYNRYRASIGQPVPRRF